MPRKKASTTENHPPSPRQTPIKFLTQAQKDAWEVLERNRITFLLGSSGAGKSQMALSYAVSETQRRRLSKVIISRPCIEAVGDNLGFLRGALDEKTAPYLAPAMAIAKKIGVLIPFEFLPIAFLRGHTFEDVIVVIEEAQNCTVPQFRLILSRLGPGSKIVFTGDTKQSDIRNSGLGKVAHELYGLPGIGIFTFQDADIVRDPLISLMLNRLENV